MIKKMLILGGLLLVILLVARNPAGAGRVAEAALKVVVELWRFVTAGWGRSS